MSQAASSDPSHNQDPSASAESGSGDKTPTLEELIADRDKWKRQSRQNENEKNKALEQLEGLRGAATERDELKKSKLTEQERFQLQLDEATKSAQSAMQQVEQYRLEAAKNKAILDAKLPASMYDNVVGNTPEELKTSAENLAAQIASIVEGVKAKGPQVPAADPSQGHQNPASDAELAGKALAQGDVDAFLTQSLIPVLTQGRQTG